jgi:hypothetical protein
MPVKNTKPPVNSPLKTTGMWKIRNISSSKRLKRKMRRNQGASYVSDTTGRNIPGCEVGPPCKCKRSKHSSLLQGRELNIFKNLWNLWDFNLQNRYLFSCIKVTRPKQAYLKNRSKSDSCRRSSMFLYRVKVEESDIKIFKQECMSVHGLQNSFWR